MKMKNLILLAFLVLGTIACNKNDNDDHSLSGTDREFLQKATYANNAEVDAGQMAVSKGTSPSIPDFGAMMVSDHQTAQSDLATIAQQMSFGVPQGLDSQHTALKLNLMLLSGYSFDSLYIYSQVIDHKKTITLFENEVSNGNDQRLKDYANKYLPKIKMHLQMADSISANF